jgi:sugar transferase (PEP-CTERM/EpsH1 system associated)
VKRRQSGRLRVLHVINSLVPLGGAERGVLKVMEGMDAKLFEQRLCTIRGFDPNMAESPALHGKLFMAGEENSAFQFLLFRLMRIIREYKPDIVHSRNWGAIEAAPAGRFAGVPVVIHSEHGYELDMLSGLPIHRRIIRRAVYSMCDAVFTVSRDLQNYHGQQVWMSPERIRVIPNGVNICVFAPHETVRRRARERFCFSPDTIVLGSVGRMVPIKGHETFLQAAEHLLESKIDVRLLLVGGGPELERHRSYAQASPSLKNRVTFVGPAEDVSELYQAMDIFVLPSISEGLSNTLLEAMASGLPCVVTDVGGNPEVVVNGRGGFLFTPEDAAGLAQRLQDLIAQDDLRAEFAVAARRHAVTHFSLDRMLDDYANLYVELAIRRGTPSEN